MYTFLCVCEIGGNAKTKSQLTLVLLDGDKADHEVLFSHTIFQNDISESLTDISFMFFILHITPKKKQTGEANQLTEM